MGAHHVAVLVLLAATAATANYVIFSQRFSADPAPIVHKGRVYLYTRYRPCAEHAHVVR